MRKLLAVGALALLASLAIIAFESPNMRSKQDPNLHDVALVNRSYGDFGGGTWRFELFRPTGLTWEQRVTECRSAALNAGLTHVEVVPGLTYIYTDPLAKRSMMLTRSLGRTEVYYFKELSGIGGWIGHLQRRRDLDSLGL